MHHLEHKVIIKHMQKLNLRAKEKSQIDGGEILYAP